MGITKKQLIQALRVNKIDFSSELKINELRQLAKAKGIDLPTEESSSVQVPAIQIGKDVETNMEDYRQRLIDSGEQVVSDEEAEEEEEINAKAIEAALSTDDMAKAIMQSLMTAAGGAAGNLADKRSNEMNQNTTLVEAVTQEDIDFLERIKKEAKLTLAVPIERNPYNHKKSIMSKQAVMRNGVPVLINGQPVLNDIYVVNINGHKFTFDLGVDNGVRPVVYIKNVPWPVAKIIARAQGQVIENPETGEVYEPPTLPPPPQNEIINGEIIQSEAMRSVVLGRGQG